MEATRTANRSITKTSVAWLVSAVITLVFSRFDYAWLALWPSMVALCIVFYTRSALSGLLIGGLCGAILVGDGVPVTIVTKFWDDLFTPIFSSPWKVSALLFTLLLGGFVALVEAGGGLQALVRKLLGDELQADRRSSAGAAIRMQLTVFAFGLLVFFDGLANTMLIGRLLRSAADKCGVSRVKLAYLADTTGSAVACMAFVSTWIAFQLSMIRDGFAVVGQEVSAYSLFFKSLPTNFYCWFALILAAVSILRDFNPGPMGEFERASRQFTAVEKSDRAESVNSGHWLLAIIPILVLTVSIPIITYLIGADALLPFTLEKFASAYGKAEVYVPQILVASSLVASIVAAAAWSRSTAKSRPVLSRLVSIYMGGIRDLLGPVAILIAAWILGAAISSLGAADLLSELLLGRVEAGLLPLIIFLVGAAISFSTGTSWGTMGVLMPLAIPVIFAVTGEYTDAQREQLVVAAIGSVFSGAVFGDHCSPFSDTTIVASIASGVEPVDHVRTQLPFAGLAAGVAGLFGFLPLGFGISPWSCLLLGSGILIGISFIPCRAKNT